MSHNRRARYPGQTLERLKETSQHEQKLGGMEMSGHICSGKGRGFSAKVVTVFGGEKQKVKLLDSGRWITECLVLSFRVHRVCRRQPKPNRLAKHFQALEKCLRQKALNPK
jgi:hypothetical protein